MRERIEAPDSQSDLISLAMGVASIPQLIEQVDAFAVFPGGGEWWRIADPISRWEHERIAARYLLIAGDNPQESTWELLNKERLRQKPYNLQRVTGVYSLLRAQHTRHQAQQIDIMIRNLRIKSIAVFVSPNHLLRAYLTILKVMLMRKYRIPLIPMPTRTPMDSIRPENGVNLWTLIPGEVTRILDYQKKGHVATLPELREYLAWLWQHPLLSKHISS